MPLAEFDVEVWPDASLVEVDEPQELELGINVSAETGVVFAKAAGEVHIAVELVWKHDGAD